MNCTFKLVPYYMDDCILFSKSLEEHLEQLEAVLMCIEKARIDVQLYK